jgi:hypothetical protein
LRDEKLDASKAEAKERARRNKAKELRPSPAPSITSASALLTPKRRRYFPLKKPSTFA